MYGIPYLNSQYLVMSENSDLTVFNAISEFIQSTTLNEFSNKLFSHTSNKI